MLSELKYPVIPQYPKGDEVRYDTDNPVRAVPIEIVGKKGDNESQQ